MGKHEAPARLDMAGMAPSLDDPGLDGASSRQPKGAAGTIIAGALIVGVTFFGFGAWAAYAPLASAVVAPAEIVSEGRVRTVQHLEGGIVSAIHVGEGARVDEGDLLFTLDPVQPSSRAARIRKQLMALRLQAARLRAEREGAQTLTLPADLSGSDDPVIAEQIEAERRLFEERRASLDGQIGLLRAQIIQFRLEVNGLDIQDVSRNEQIRLISQELDSIRPLLADGLIARSRVLSLERDRARLEGERGDIGARRARANESVAEAELEIAQLRQSLREEVASELREVGNQIADLEEQAVAADDVIKRLAIRAPIGGIVQNMSVTTQGAVISRGNPLLEIAPQSDALLIAAEVPPADAHDVAPGQRAEVRFTALNTRTAPTIYGMVRSVSGDRLTDEASGTDYFLVQIAVPAEEIAKLGGQRIHAGMPTDVVLPTGTRSLLDYLLKPLSDAMVRSLTEE